MNDWTVSEEYKMTESIAKTEWTFDFGETELAGQRFMIKTSALVGLYAGATNTVGTLAEGAVRLQYHGCDIKLSPRYKSAKNVKITYKYEAGDTGDKPMLMVTGDFIEDESYTAPAPVSSTEPSGTLPVLYITTATPKSDIDGADNKDVIAVGTCYIDSKGLDGLENLGDNDNQYAVSLQGRGNYTWNGFDKKPYKMKFESKTAPLGLSASKKFALMAGADDVYSQLRNVVGFEVSRRMGMPWTPNQQPVEVVWNGDYIGLYMITETIKIDKNGVNITEQADNETDSHAITGGWLVEIDNNADIPQVVLQDAGNPWLLRITGSSPEEWSAEQEAYITDQWQHIYDAVSTNDWETVARYLDIESAARYYVIQEITENRESYNGSCYLYKDRDPDDGTSSSTGSQQTKWMFGPVWDFGSSFTSYNNGRPQYVWEDYAFNAHIINHLHSDPTFMESVRDQWHRFLVNGYDGLATYIHNFMTKTATAAKSDAARWPKFDHSDVTAAEATYIARLEERMSWLIDQWGDASGIEVINCNTDALAKASCFYNILGIQVKTLEDGKLYIHNGKKVVWKNK